MTGHRKNGKNAAEKGASAAEIERAREATAMSAAQAEADAREQRKLLDEEQPLREQIRQLAGQPNLLAALAAQAGGA